MRRTGNKAAQKEMQGVIERFSDVTGMYLPGYVYLTDRYNHITTEEEKQIVFPSLMATWGALCAAYYIMPLITQTVGGVLEEERGLGVDVQELIELAKANGIYEKPIVFPECFYDEVE